MLPPGPGFPARAWGLPRWPQERSVTTRSCPSSGAAGWGSSTRRTRSRSTASWRSRCWASSLSGDPSFVARFVREAQAAAALSHPNIIQIFFIGEDNGRHYFVMEYVKGKSLLAMVEEEGRDREPAGDAVHAAGGQRPGRGPRQGISPPRHQAGQPARGRERSPQDRGLRARAPSGSRHAADRHGDAGRHARVPVARAVYGAADGHSEPTSTPSA